MEKILVIKLGALGDFVLSIGTMRRIQELHPQAEFTLMTGSPFVSIAKQMGMFSHYIIDNRGSYFNLPDRSRLVREVMAGDFDRIYDLQANSRTRKKYFSALRFFLPRSFVWCDAYLGRERRVEKTHRWGIGTVHSSPAENPGRTTDLSFLHGEGKYFHLLPERFVLLIPGCSPNHPHKRWPIANFSELARRLAERGIGSVLIGTAAEEKELTEIAASTPLAVNMMNKTSLADVPQLALRALATVGNDTGPSHMASLSGAPAIALYDNRTKQGALTGPRSVNMVSPSTIDLITPDMVWEKLQPFLG